MVSLASRSLTAGSALRTGLVRSLVCVVEFVDVVAVASVVRRSYGGRADSAAFDGRGAVTLLGVQGAAVNSDSAVDRVQNDIVGVLIGDGVALGVVSEVRLVHQLLIEAGIDRHVAAC